MFVSFWGRDPLQSEKRGPVWDEDFAWGITVSFPRLIYCKNYISLIEVRNQHFEKLHSESKIFRNENQDPFLLSQVKSQYNPRNLSAAYTVADDLSADKAL